MLNTLQYILRHPLGGRNKSATLIRYLRWQIGSRIVLGPVIVPFVDDSVLVVDRGMTGATGNIYCGLHEFVDMAFLLHFLRPTDRFLDVGANVGSYTVLAANAVGASVVSVEPVDASFQALHRNIRMNNVQDRVQAVKCIAGAKTGACSMSTDKGPENRVVDSSYTGTVANLPVKTIDDLLGQTPCGLWKLDVEGYEEQVMKGAVQSLASPGLEALIIEGNTEVICETLRKHDFELVRYNPNDRRLARQHRVGTYGGSCNHIWVRDFESAQERVADARKFRVGTFQI